jgi:enoyl-CoA hydratase/carnithine racemase
MESLTTLLFKVSEHVAYFTLNRPAVANVVSLELAEELQKVAARMRRKQQRACRFADRCRTDFLRRRR